MEDNKMRTVEEIETEIAKIEEQLKTMDADDLRYSMLTGRMWGLIWVLKLHG